MRNFFGIIRNVANSREKLIEKDGIDGRQLVFMLSQLGAECRLYVIAPALS